MKNLCAILCTILMTSSLWAYDFEKDGLYYVITCNIDPYTVALSYEFDESAEGPAYEGYKNIRIPSVVTYDSVQYTVTSIANEAFYGCTTLKSVVIPKSITHIGIDAFVGTALYNNPSKWKNGILYIDNCLISVDERFYGDCRIKDNTRVIADGAFSYCKNLTSVTIPKGIQRIGDYTFDSCDSLTIVHLPNTIKSIGVLAFHACSALTTLNLPSSLTSIGWNAWSDCSSLSSLTIPTNVTHIVGNALDHTPIYHNPSNWKDDVLCVDGCLIDAKESIAGACIVDDSIRLIADYAFGDCVKLTSVVISDSVAHIGNHAWNGCYDLQAISVSEGNPVYDSRENCNAIIETATNTLVIGCSNSKIPPTVTSIGVEAFVHCKNLNSITIPKSVTYIDEGAFYDAFLSEINYEGTISEWNEVYLGFDWATNVHATYVQCIDGKVEL